MTALVVVAHPDDEVLGCGAAGSLWARSGSRVVSCILSGRVTARGARPDESALLDDTLKAQEILGFDEPILGDFPNIAMNSVAHLELVQFIEEAMVQTGADFLVTHHPYDINDDHRQVAMATMAAARLSHRSGEARCPQLRELLHMEILSSTEWQFPTAGQSFSPDTYVPLDEESLTTKLRALEAYRGVMRPFPHPRSEPALRAQATMRGVECGEASAEAFATGFRHFRGPS